MESVNITLQISDPLFAEAKRFAAARGLTLREVVESGLRRVLEPQPPGAKRFRLRKVIFKGRGLAADADWNYIREMIYEGRGGRPR